MAARSVETVFELFHGFANDDKKNVLEQLRQEDGKPIKILASLW